MKNRLALFACSLLLGCVAGVPAAAPEKKPTPALAADAKGPVRYGMPRLAPGQLWVTSVPTGLEVRTGESPLAGKVVGRTPVVLQAADKTQFVTVVLLRKEFGADLPRQSDLGDFTAKTSHSGVHQEGGRETDYMRAITYEVKPGRQTVIALFQPRSLPLSEADRLFPPGSNFDFPDVVAAEPLTQKGVPAADVVQAVSLLHRGGKVLVRQGLNYLVAEVIAPGVVEVFDLADLMAAPRPTPERKP